MLPVSEKISGRREGATPGLISFHEPPTPAQEHKHMLCRFGTIELVIRNPH